MSTYIMPYTLPWLVYRIAHNPKYKIHGDQVFKIIRWSMQSCTYDSRHRQMHALDILLGNQKKYYALFHVISDHMATLDNPINNKDIKQFILECIAHIGEPLRQINWMHHDGDILSAYFARFPSSFSPGIGIEKLYKAVSNGLTWMPLGFQIDTWTNLLNKLKSRPKRTYILSALEDEYPVVHRDVIHKVQSSNKRKPTEHDGDGHTSKCTKSQSSC